MSMAACSSADGASGAADSEIQAGSPIVTTSAGAVRGAQASSGAVLAWKGVPFGASPTADLRWRPTQPVAPWQGVRDATKFGAKCMQPGDKGVEGDEDCLTVNVWKPASSEPGLPVMVFFYGGFNVTGSTADTLFNTEIYDGAHLAQGAHAVVVTANYRVGAMGFLAHDSLAASSGAGAASGPGNYGLYDQIEALRWVQKNAAAFGGDASRVTVFGQSAGAFDTCALVASPLAKGLFSRAAMHSGGCRAISRATGESSGKIVADRLGCSGAPDVAACLRSKPAKDVTSVVPMAEAAGGSFYWPIVDGAVLPKPPLQIISAGEHNHVPVILGSNRDEASLIVRQFAPDIIFTESAYEKAMAGFGPKITEDAIAAYPASSYLSPDVALQNALGDNVFICPTRRAARALTASQKEPVYRYEFTHSLHDLVLGLAGASHGFDLFFLFKNFVHLFPSAGEETLADTFAGYWGRFAATGDPNGAAAVRWAPYDATADSDLMLDETVAPGTGRRGPQCDFWDRVAAASGE
jgi:para-nitrobenzyl esterase